MSAAELLVSSPPPLVDAPAAAPDLAHLVLEGRARVVARFDADSRRAFVLAPARSASTSPRMRGLRSDALPRLAAGLANKAIALELGRAESTVSRALGAWCRALGVVSTAELAQLARALKGPARTVAGAGGWIVTVDLERGWSSAGLTLAEADVAALAVRGFTNAQIARHRGTSVATVVNQLGAVHRKLGTSGRVGLGAARAID